jgi:hypothetical protein
MLVRNHELRLSNRNAVRRLNALMPIESLRTNVSIASPASSASPSASPRIFYATTSSLSGNDRVREALNERARGIQQLGFKTILKAWIKAICPKKQAKFPYKEKEEKHDSKAPRVAHKIPGWWPSVDKCRYLEPDHINKKGMSNACNHSHHFTC